MIQTKVAKVLNSTSVILAAGAEHGIKEGMEFVIYDLSEMIRDPETFTILLDTIRRFVRWKLFAHDIR